MRRTLNWTGWSFSLLVAAVGTAAGQTLWTNPGADVWTTPGNWSAGVPTAVTNAQINNGGTAKILTIGAAANVMSLGANPGDWGTVEIQGGGAQFTSDF